MAERVSEFEQAHSRKLMKQVAELERWRAALERRLDFLERTRERLETAVAAAPIALVGFDALGVVQLWNHAAEVLLGCPAQKIVGSTASVLGAAGRQVSETIARVLRDERVAGEELNRRWKGGPALSLRISGRPITTEAGVLRGGVLVIGARAFLAPVAMDTDQPARRSQDTRSTRLRALGRLFSRKKRRAQTAQPPSELPKTIAPAEAQPPLPSNPPKGSTMNSQ